MHGLTAFRSGTIRCHANTVSPLYQTISNNIESFHRHLIAKHSALRPRWEVTAAQMMTLRMSVFLFDFQNENETASGQEWAGDVDVDSFQ